MLRRLIPMLRASVCDLMAIGMSHGPAVSPRHVDRADDVLSQSRPDRRRAVACRAGPARRSAAARSRARQAVCLRGWPTAPSRSSGGTAPIRQDSYASPRRACWSSAIAATRAPLNWRPEKFNQYLKDEGLDAIAALRANATRQDAGARSFFPLREESGTCGSTERQARGPAAGFYARARGRTKSIRHSQWRGTSGSLDLRESPARGRTRRGHEPH